MNNVIKTKGIAANIVKVTRRLLKIIQFRGRYPIAKLIASICLPNGKVLFPHNNGRPMVFDLRNPHEVAMLFDLFAEDLTCVLNRILRPNDVFIDCGANIGYFTFMAAAITTGEHGKVVAIDANPYCEKRIKLSRHLGDYHNVDIYGVAVGKSDGHIDFNIATDPMFSSFSDLNLLKFAKTGETISVPVVRADRLINDILKVSDTVRFIKIDVEGAEIDVLKGMSMALKNSTVEYIFIEIHPQQLAAQGQNPNDVKAILEENGYENIEQFGRWSHLYRSARAS